MKRLLSVFSITGSQKHNMACFSIPGIMGSMCQFQRKYECIKSDKRNIMKKAPVLQYRMPLFQAKNAGNRIKIVQNAKKRIDKSSIKMVYLHKQQTILM